MLIRDTILSEYDHEMATTRRLLERLPDDKLAWRPHEKSMTMGGLATHLANIPNWGGSILTETSFDTVSAPLKLEARGSRSEILGALKDACERTRGLMDRSDEDYMVMWTLKHDGHDLYSSPRVTIFRSFVIHHAIHHRGQLSLYLRLNDVPLPPIYGPTADEAWS